MIKMPIKIINRSMDIPIPEQTIGYTGDNLVEVRTFELDRMYGNIDLSGFDFRLDTQIGEHENVIYLDKTISDDKITLTWVVDESHIQYPGDMTIQIRAFNAVGVEKWHTDPVTVKVKKAINALSSLPSPLPSEFEQMEQRVTVIQSDVIEKAAEVEADRAEVATNTETVLEKAEEALQSAAAALQSEINAKTSEDNAKAHAEEAERQAGIAVQALADINTRIEGMFYLVGDSNGVDDTAMIKSVITQAGENGRIIFKSGQTYLISSRLQPLTGQTWFGYGACLKRIDEVKTTTTDNITTDTNPTTINVADASGFRVGMEVTVTTGRNNNEGCYIPHTITAINGNQITVTGNFTKSFPNGGTVVANFGLIRIGAERENIKIFGLELDGNRANNDTYLNWQTQASLVGGGRKCGVFRDLYIHDSQADGIILGGEGTVVENCRIIDSGGNAIHLSGAKGCKIVNNHCKNATLSIDGTDNTTGPDHAEGVITFSSLIEDALIDGNYLENGRTCIGGIGSYDNSDITITNNTMRGATLYAIEFRTSETASPYLRNLIVSNNRFYDCAPVSLENNQSGATAYETGNRNVVFSNNILVNTRLNTTRLKHATIEGNIFELTGNTTNTIMYVSRCRSLTVSNNHFIGGRYGVFLGYSPDSGLEIDCSDVLINSNEFRNQYDASISAATENGTVYRNVKIHNNTILIESGAAMSGYVGIYAGSGTLTAHNTLNIKGGSIGIRCFGDTVSNPYGYVGSIVEGNIIRTDNGVPSIRIYGGTKNNIVHHNYIVQPIKNSQPDDNIVEDNYTIL